MASACVKTAGVSPENFSAHGWSLGREDNKRSSSQQPPPLPDNQDPVVDFEFCLEDPVTMLSADQLFSDGKLVPLKFSGPVTMQTAVNTTTTEPRASPEVLKSCRRLEMEISDLFSPKAPRCTTRWRELLGLKRLVNAKAQESVKTTSSSSSSSSPNPKTSSFKQFLHRGSKSSASAASSPLLKESDISESISIASSRLSLSSSSSSGHEIDDLPRLSLDLDKPSPNPFAPSRTHLRNPNQPRIRLAKPRRHHPPSTPSVDGSSSSSPNINAGESRGITVTADSPRLNASGKIVFHGLERSSSSPGSFTGGPRMKQHHGMPRSYSANVRITPVLNVPVCSLKSGLFFGQLFSSSSSSSSSTSSSSSSSPSPGNKSHLQSNAKNRTNRTRLEPKCEQ